MRKLNTLTKTLFMLSIYTITFFSEKLSWGFRSSVFYLAIMLVIGLALNGAVYKILSILVIAIGFSSLILGIEISFIRPLWYVMVVALTIGTVYDIIQVGDLNSGK